MCNAWNHETGCSCGFGGEGHLGGGWGSYKTVADEDFLKKIISEYKDEVRNDYNSFVIPNALCPVCGAQVFYYQSPFGGRVFFDELQPPWPKHPCTDNNNRLKLIETRNLRFDKPLMIKGNWFPLTLHKNFVRIIDDYILIAGSINQGNSYTRFKEYLIKNDDSLKYGNPLFYKRTSGHKFEISTFVIHEKSVQELILPGWKRKEAILIYPKIVKYLKVRIGDKVKANFKGEYKGIHLKLHPIDWDFRKNCLIDKIDLLESKRAQIKSNPHSVFLIEGVVTRIIENNVFIKEV